MGKKRNAEIFCNSRVAFSHLCAHRCAEDLTDRACKDVNHADEHNEPVAEHIELELCARKHEEQKEQGSGPFVGLAHDLVREVAHVAEHGAEHHTNEKRGELDVDAVDVCFEHRKSNRHYYKGDGKGKTLTVRFEVFFSRAEENTEYKTEQERKNDLQKRLDKNRDRA